MWRWKTTRSQAPGIRVGSFILRPTVEQGITATSNADSSTTGSPAVMSETALRLNATSDWTSNLATIDAYGTFRTTLSGDEVQEGAGGVNAMLQLDLGNDYQAIGKLGYAIAPESAASPVSIANTTSEPLRQSLSWQPGAGKGRWQGAFRRSPAALTTKAMATPISKAAARCRRRTATRRFIRSRCAPDTRFRRPSRRSSRPNIGRNLYDLEYDTAGYARSSNQFGVRGGLALDLTEKLTGEVSVGWVVEDFDDPRLETISTPSFGADLAWSPMRGTMVGLSGATTLEGTTTPDQSGSVLYSGLLSVEREMRANLTGNVILGAGWRDYWGSDGHDLISRRRGRPDLVAEPLRRRDHPGAASNRQQQPFRPRFRDQQHLPRAEAAALDVAAQRVDVRRSVGFSSSSILPMTAEIPSRMSGRASAKATLASTKPSGEPQSKVRPR